MFRKVVFLLFFAPAIASADPDVYLQVIGVAQDVGYPQTNCYQPHCMRAWDSESLRRMTSSIAVVHAAAKSKYLFDATKKGFV
jgi:pyrroloquinoline quinone biosynthesis protein B